MTQYASSHDTFQLPPRHAALSLGAVASVHVAVFAALWFLASPAERIQTDVLSVRMISVSPPAEAPVKPVVTPPKPVVETPRPKPVVQRVRSAEPAPAPLERKREPEPPPPQPVVSKPAPPEPALAPPVVPPRFDAGYLNNPAPAYPALSRRNGEEGKVLLRVLVSADGKAQEVLLHQGSGFVRLDDAALDAVRRWRFVPARRGDDAFSDWVIVPVVFKLTR